MPIFIPFVLGFAALSAGGFGLYQGGKGVSSLQDAKELIQSSEALHQQEVVALKCIETQTNNLLVAYRSRQEQAFHGVVQRYLRVLAALRDRLGERGIEVLLSLTASPQQVHLAQSTLQDVQRISAGALRGASLGAAAQTMAVGLAGLGTASTGTAISTLSGAAASSAKLAWLGGGSLASGGFGMAGGTVVLGALVAAPVLLLGGLALGGVGEERLAEARRFQSEVARVVSQMRSVGNRLRDTQQRVTTLDRCLAFRVEVAEAHLASLERRVRSFRSDRWEDRSAFLEAQHTVASVIDFLKTPVIKEDFSLHPGAEYLIALHGTLPGSAFSS